MEATALGCCGTACAVAVGMAEAWGRAICLPHDQEAKEKERSQHLTVPSGILRGSQTSPKSTFHKFYPLP